MEVARNNKMWEVEYKTYYANLQDKYNKGLVEGRDAGIGEGLKAGLFALVTTQKSILKDFDKVCEAVQSNETYSDVTRELSKVSIMI